MYFARTATVESKTEELKRYFVVQFDGDGLILLEESNTEELKQHWQTTDRLLCGLLNQVNLEQKN